MAEILKTGLIPASNAVVYKENFKISDSPVGKYVSLTEFKKFHNPGTGLDLSTPSTEVIVVSNEFKSVDQSANASGSAGSYSAVSFLFFPTNTVIVDNLSGAGKKNIGVETIGLPAGTVLDKPAVFNTTNSGGELIKAQVAGTYVISFSSNGSVTNSVSNGSFTAWIQFFVRVKGVETALTGVVSYFSPGGKARPQYASNSFTVNYSGTVNLGIGDTVEVYGKSSQQGYNGANHNCNFSSSNTTLSVKMDSTSGPTQTYFSNPQNIPQMNIKSINYYGNAKDTLKLIGNKLTS